MASGSHSSTGQSLPKAIAFPSRRTLRAVVSFRGFPQRVVGGDGRRLSGAVHGLPFGAKRDHFPWDRRVSGRGCDDRLPRHWTADDPRRRSFADAVRRRSTGCLGSFRARYGAQPLGAGHGKSGKSEAGASVMWPTPRCAMNSEARSELPDRGGGQGASRYLRIALLIRSMAPGGVERQLALLAGALKARGHDGFCTSSMDLAHLK